MIYLIQHACAKQHRMLITAWDESTPVSIAIRKTHEAMLSLEQEFGAKKHCTICCGDLSVTEMTDRFQTVEDASRFIARTMVLQKLGQSSN